MSSRHSDGTVISSLIYLMRTKNIMTFNNPDAYSLGKNIDENSQLRKATIDMLLFFGSILQVSERHYQRTYKKLTAIIVSRYNGSAKHFQLQVKTRSAKREDMTIR